VDEVTAVHKCIEVGKAIYSCCPGKFDHIAIGIGSSLSRMALDDRMCNNGLATFLRNLARQFLVSIAAVTICAGLLILNHVDESVAPSFSVDGHEPAVDKTVKLAESIVRNGHPKAPLTEMKPLF